MFNRIKNFLFQLVFLVIAFVINVLAVAPIYIIKEAENNSFEINNIYMMCFIPVCYAASVGLNKLFLKLKGFKTEWAYEKQVLYVEKKLTRIVGNDIYIDVDVSAGTEYEFHNTFWGWVAAALSFVAFPIRLIAFVFSYFALFFPVIYSTFKRLPDNEDFSLINKILHFFFDFVFIPAKLSSADDYSVKKFFIALGCVLSYIVLTAISTVAILILSPGDIPVLYGLFTFFCLISQLILLIKYCIITFVCPSTKIIIFSFIKIFTFPIVNIILALILPYLL